MDETQGEQPVEEVVILVDEQDRVIGREAKTACHRHPVPFPGLAG